MITQSILALFFLWDSRNDEQHWQKKNWPVRDALVMGQKNVINERLVNRDRIIFLPLHIKLGLMKQSVKVLDKKRLLF